MKELLLAADIGGTKTDLGLYAVEAGKLKTIREATVPTSSYGSASGIFDTFLLMEAQKLKSACIAVAGHVSEGVVVAPNLPWTINFEKICNSLESPKVLLINDLVATAWGVLDTGEEDLVQLQPGTPHVKGTKVLLAPGTGLGQSIMVWTERGYLPIPTEGGHSDFAPANEQQIDLLRYARRKTGGHVSWERLVSGLGIKMIYDFVIDTGLATSSKPISDRINTMDSVPVITEVGVCGEDLACERTLDIFLELLGAEAGNLALKTLPYGGLYLAGGMAERIRTKINSSMFLDAFRAKGRMTELMKTFPVSLTNKKKLALLGASLLGMKTFY